MASKHHMHPLTQRCVECGALASDMEDGRTICDPQRQRHFLLVEIGGTSNVYAPRGTKVR